MELVEETIYVYHVAKNNKVVAFGKIKGEIYGLVSNIKQQSIDGVRNAFDQQKPIKGSYPGVVLTGEQFTEMLPETAKHYV